MKPTPDRKISNMAGEAALPRKSGELVFHDAWERRAFALAVALCEQGQYQWDEFRDHLIAAIGVADEAQADKPDTPVTGYYEHWLAALEKVLIDKGLCTPDQIRAGEGGETSPQTPPPGGSQRPVPRVPRPI
jgi:nitrile hydratase accessory protein